MASSLADGRFAEKIVAGKNHTCVLANDRTVWCWGDNSSGQLGTGDNLVLKPTRVNLPLNAVTIGAGGNSTCAELTDGTARCWGDNSVGQWGDGTANNVPAPGSFGVVSGVKSTPGANEFAVAGFSAGPSHVCAVADAGTVWCWGSYENGRLGSSSASNAATPRATAALPAGTALQVAAGHAHSCVVMSTGAMPCFGLNDWGQLGRDPGSVADSNAPIAVTGVTATRASAGRGFTCAVGGGSVSCFGDDFRGQLGDGAGDSSGFAPRGVVGITGTVVDVVAGFEFACAVTSVGAVWCWGANSLGQLGLGDAVPRRSAVAVSNLAVNPSTTTTTTTTTTTSTTTTSTTVTPTTVPTQVATPPAVTLPSPSSTTVGPGPDTATTTSSPTSGSSSTGLLRAAPSTTSTVAGRKVAAPVRRTQALRRGRMLTAAQIARAVGLAIPRRSQGTMRISISTGRARCVFDGSAIRGVQRGTCTVTVVLAPRRGRPTVRTLTVWVR